MARYQVWALDVDGTLLDGGGAVPAATRGAIGAAVGRGVRVVLCTGRRYRRAREVAVELGLLGAPLVTNSGALVKDPATHGTLWRLDLVGGWFERVTGWLAGRERRLVSFTDRGPGEADFLIERESAGCPYYDEYIRMNRRHAEIRPEWLCSVAPDARFHLCAIGARVEMRALEVEVLERFGGVVRTFVQKSPRYTGTMCEILHAGASKWRAVEWLLGGWGIPAGAVAAFGDDENDLPMLEGAGLAVAMAHAPEHVRSVARVIRTPETLGSYLRELLPSTSDGHPVNEGASQ